MEAFLCGSEHCWKLELGGREWWDEGGRGELIVTSSKLSLHSGGAFVEPLPSHDRLADQNSSKKQKAANEDRPMNRRLIFAFVS